MIKRNLTFIILGLLLGLLAFLSASYGAVHISYTEIINALQHFNDSESLALNERIFLTIRLPRTLLAIIVGAALAVGGVLVQGLFRNPIVEPGLIGISGGAAFGSAIYFVLGTSLDFEVGNIGLPFMAVLGSVFAIFCVLIITGNSKRQKQIILLLLSGIAINALCMSGVGFMSYIARDPQARSITFWGLGTLSSASMKSVFVTAPLVLIGILYSIRLSKSLNALMLGENEASYLGINTKQLKFQVIAIIILIVSTCTAFVGVISFVGLVVPHLMRLLGGSNNKWLIQSSAIAGGILLLASDLIARLLLAPAELPLGIVTSLIGVPIFIILLKKKAFIYA